MTDKMREEFETWWSQDSQAELRSSCAKGWTEVVWRASRAALVIEWPDQHTYTIPDCAGAAILDCRTAFSKAVKVKP